MVMAFLVRNHRIIIFAKVGVYVFALLELTLHMTVTFPDKGSIVVAPLSPLDLPAALALSP